MKGTPQTALLTGGTSGIGKAVAKKLAKTGVKLYLSYRDPDKAQAFIDELKALSGNEHIYGLECDLGSLSSVADMANQFLAREEPLDLLINNAGILGQKNRTVSKDGYEMTLAVNYLSTYLLTIKLLPAIRRGAPAKIINVISLFYQSITHEDFPKVIKDFNATEKYDPYRQYALSKLAIFYLTIELSKKLKSELISVNALHPGMVFTRMSKNMSFFSRLRLKLFRTGDWSSPEQAAEKYLHLCSLPQADNVTGRLFSDNHLCEPTPIALNQAYSKTMLDLSHDLVRDYL